MPAFMAIGMHCMGCALASGETLEEACYAHEVDPDLFLEKLNAYPGDPLSFGAGPQGPALSLCHER